jgi:hypothetical protein
MIKAVFVEHNEALCSFLLTSSAMAMQCADEAAHWSRVLRNYSLHEAPHLFVYDIWGEEEKRAVGVILCNLLESVDPLVRMKVTLFRTLPNYEVTLVEAYCSLLDVMKQQYRYLELTVSLNKHDTNQGGINALLAAGFVNNDKAASPTELAYTYSTGV